MTWNDEIVEEVRRVRNEHAEKFNHDISAICADIRRKQAAGGRTVVSLERKDIEKEKSDILQPAQLAEIKRTVETVLQRGRVVIENGEHKGKAGDGQFLKRGECMKI